MTIDAEKRMQRNSEARAYMLAQRIRNRNARAGGVHSVHFIAGKPVVEFYPRPSRIVGYPAAINRRTGKPHEHRRAIARRLARAA